MKLSQLLDTFPGQARSKALKALIADRKLSHINAVGLAGSSAAMMLASLPKPKQPVIVVGTDPDDAGYLYHDLSRLAGDDAVVYFPSAYK
ncbi:MAG: hypothetical protein K2G64_04320, partial [Muribaculaceae bacterium]|nr:hypothetical protein [Muribaculaceae bacterium]